MAQNGSKMEVTMVEVAAEVMEVLMALNQIARFQAFSLAKAKTQFRRIFYFFF